MLLATGSQCARQRYQNRSLQNEPGSRWQVIKRLQVDKNMDSQDKLICSNKKLSTLWWALFQEPERGSTLSRKAIVISAGRVVIWERSQITAAVSAAIAAASWAIFPLRNLLGPPPGSQGFQLTPCWVWVVIYPEPSNNFIFPLPCGILVERTGWDNLYWDH